VLTAICFRPLGPGQRSGFLKKSRVHMDLAQASVAALLEMEGDPCRAARLAAGSVGPTPLRLVSVEQKLAGARLTDALLQEVAGLASEAVAPIDDIRSTEAYRRRIVGVYVKRLVRALGGDA